MWNGCVKNGATCIILLFQLHKVNGDVLRICPVVNRRNENKVDNLLKFHFIQHVSIYVARFKWNNKWLMSNHQVVVQQNVQHYNRIYLFRWPVSLAFVILTLTQNKMVIRLACLDTKKKKNVLETRLFDIKRKRNRMNWNNVHKWKPINIKLDTNCTFVSSAIINIWFELVEPPFFFCIL